jgi:hypothetical protein
MALRFIAIDPDTDTNHCPAVFIDEKTGDFLFQGWTVTDPNTLAESSQHSPIADNESLVRLPARMRCATPTILTLPSSASGSRGPLGPCPPSRHGST